MLEYVYIPLWLAKAMCSVACSMVALSISFNIYFVYILACVCVCSYILSVHACVDLCVEYVNVFMRKKDIFFGRAEGGGGKVACGGMREGE